MSATTIPVTITPEAAARVAELGLRHELEQMLEYLSREVPGVLSVEVQLAPPYDTGDEPTILLEVLLDRPLADLGAQRQIRDWKIRTFPPQVRRHFTTLTVPAPFPGEALLPGGVMGATNVTVTITPEAERRVAELGMGRELRAILDRALQSLTGLRSVEVTLRECYDTGDQLGLYVEATFDPSNSSARQEVLEWRSWLTDTFPMDIGQYFTLLELR